MSESPDRKALRAIASALDGSAANPEKAARICRNLAANSLAQPDPCEALADALRLIAHWDHPSHPRFGDVEGRIKPSVESFADIARAALAAYEGGKS